MDHGDDGKLRGRQRVLIPLSSGGNGILRAPPHWGVHHEAAGNHRIKWGLPPHLGDVHGGGVDAGDNLVHAMVGTRRGK